MRPTTLRQLVPLRRRKILKKSLSRAVKVLCSGALVSLIGYGLYSWGLVQVPDEYQNLKVAVLVAWFGLLLVLMFWKMAYEYIYFLNYFYDIDDKNLFIRKGIITKKTIILPFKRITDVYVDQDIWDVSMGLYDVHFATPTAESGRFAHIDGVDRQGAEKLRDLILDRIHREE